MTRFLRLPLHPTTTETHCGACGSRVTIQRSAKQLRGLASDIAYETYCDLGIIHDGDAPPLVPVMSSTRKGALIVNAERHARCVAASE